MRSDEYKFLINKKITYRWTNRNPYLGYTRTGNRLIEIIYNGEVINPPKDNSTVIFAVSLAVFLLSLYWCIWVFLRKWRKYGVVEAIEKKDNSDNNI